MHGRFVCMCVCVPCVCLMTAEARGTGMTDSCDTPRGFWELNTEPSIRTVSALNCCSISPTPSCSFKNLNIKKRKKIEVNRKILKMVLKEFFFFFWFLKSWSLVCSHGWTGISGIEWSQTLCGGQTGFRIRDFLKWWNYRSEPLSFTPKGVLPDCLSFRRVARSFVFSSSKEANFLIFKTENYMKSHASSMIATAEK